MGMVEGRKVQESHSNTAGCPSRAIIGKVCEGPAANFRIGSSLRNAIRRIPYDIKGFIILDDQHLTLALHLGLLDMGVCWSLVIGQGRNRMVFGRV